MTEKQKTQGVLYTLVDGAPRFLILKRSPEEGGYWQPLTGSVEEGETELECLKRELEEEIGLSASAAEFTDVIYEFDWAYENVRYHEFVRGVKIDLDATIVLSEEHDEYKWCDLEEALDLLKHESNKHGFRTITEFYSRQ